MAPLSSSDGLGNYLTIESVGLTLDDFYRTLNRDDTNLEDYASECKTLLSKNSYFTYDRLCKKLLKFLKSSSKLSDKKYSTYDDCILFNYWIYNEIAQINNYNYIYKVYPAFGELNNMWNNLIDVPSKESYYNKCEPDFNIPQQDDWKERKQLYDYCVNSGTIVNTANMFPHTCKDIYTYIKGKVHLYEHFKTRCLSKKEKQCPKFYSECEKYHPNILLPQLDCYNDMQKQEPDAAEKVLSVKQRPELPAGDIFSSDELRSKKDSSTPVTQVGNVLLGVVVTSMTSGALYKFTPLGRMLRNGLGRNNNIIHLNGGDNGLFDYASESFNPYSGEEHYIGYHPA
ncbi:Plasmodium vivax Vir protein, putative [Plasmodium vivax]|uniref:Vir protein, putative n=1 Tax=Plasmodium vivax TaxID=5855 RepID=A0A1G4EE41_PLAVI|nr:Plasmodium vivax Vir protein, putative [Plasmodium vivax]